jgi:hypothetical protein
MSVIGIDRQVPQGRHFINRRLKSTEKTIRQHLSPAGTTHFKYRPCGTCAGSVYVFSRNLTNTVNKVSSLRDLLLKTYQIHKLFIFHFFTAILFIFNSCETPISITLPHSENVKVIEGWIENDQPAIVVISNSLSYYSDVNLEAIMASVDTNAIVRISDDMGNTERLLRKLDLEHSIKHPFGAYGLLTQIPLTYIGEQIKGIPGHTYTLYIESKGEIYTSQTTIPLNTVQVDSFGLQTLFNDTMATLRIYFSDPAESFDCYRFFLKLKDLDLVYSQIFTGTFDDLTFNGLTGSYEMLRSPMSNLSIPGMSQQQREDYYRSTFRKGDIIYVKSTLTDKATKEYWFPLQMDVSMGMNPFLTPGTYPTNIEGENVTGIWSGYHARYDTVEYK